MGVDLPRDKRMEIALTYIYGIGRTRSQEILEATGISRDQRTKDLTDDQVTQLRDYIEANLKSRVTCAASSGRYPSQDRDRLLPGPAPPSWPARARSAHQDQCAHPQGPEAHHRRKKKAR
jgi:hypothetical protein